MFKQDREYALKEAAQDWRSNLYVPIVFSTIETFVPNVTMSIVRADPIVVMKANSREDVLPAKIGEKLCNILMNKLCLRILLINFQSKTSKKGISLQALPTITNYRLTNSIEFLKISVSFLFNRMMMASTAGPRCSAIMAKTPFPYFQWHIFWMPWRQ